MKFMDVNNLKDMIRLKANALQSSSMAIHIVTGYNKIKIQYQASNLVENVTKSLTI